MKQRKLLSIVTMLTMLFLLVPSLPASAANDTIYYKRVTSANEIVAGARYLVVGCSDDGNYYAIGNEYYATPDTSVSMRSAVPLQKNADETLNLADGYSGAHRPLNIRLIQNGTDQYFFKILDDMLGIMYLNAFYSTASKTYPFNDNRSRALHITKDVNGKSSWELDFREDGNVVFKNTKTISKETNSSYIRFFHNAEGEPAFSAGLIGDSQIDLPAGLELSNLNENNIPVQTYLYKEICTHDNSDLTTTEAVSSTCSTQGNTKYYYCNNCCVYLNTDKKEITLEDTVLPLLPHSNTVYTEATQPNCTSPGNIAYTKCNDCGKFFEGNSTETEITKAETEISTNNNHPNLIHFPGKEPTCIKDGILEHWFCELCYNYFSDSEATNVLDPNDIKLVSDGPKDDDNDDICDVCEKPMPVFTKVTSADELVMGNQYILVTERDTGYPRVLSLPEMKGEDYYDLGQELPAKLVTPLADGSIDYNTARNNSIIMRLDFACEWSDVEEDTIRYGLRTVIGNKLRAFEDYDGFCMNEEAKYGWNISINEDGSVAMSGVYGSWNNIVSKENLYATSTNEDETISVFFSSAESKESISKYPIYLYRLTETGSSNNAVPYRLSDSKSTVSSEIALPSLKASKLSNVSGISKALKRATIDNLLSDAQASSNVRIAVDANIAVKEFVKKDEKDEKDENGQSITYSINPKLKITLDDAAPLEYDIQDSYLDGSPMTVTLYTGGIEPRQIIHYKQDGSKEYFYYEWSYEVQENGEKAFSFSYDTKGNCYVTLELTEFSDIKILDTPEVSATSISSYDEKARTVTVSCASAGNYTLIFADFENSRLNNMVAEPTEFKAGENIIPLPKTAPYLSSGDKIMLWEDLISLYPLCEAYPIK